MALTHRSLALLPVGIAASRPARPALALAGRMYALARGRIVLTAPTADADLPHRLKRAYFGERAAVRENA